MAQFDVHWNKGSLHEAIPMRAMTVLFPGICGFPTKALSGRAVWAVNMIGARTRDALGRNSIDPTRPDLADRTRQQGNNHP